MPRRACCASSLSGGPPHARPMCGPSRLSVSRRNILRSVVHTQLVCRDDRRAISRTARTAARQRVHSRRGGARAASSL
eukprot:5043050-Prymnesium_polylepis.1